jgi:hypothetical protein
MQVVLASCGKVNDCPVQNDVRPATSQQGVACLFRALEQNSTQAEQHKTAGAVTAHEQRQLQYSRHTTEQQNS